MELSTYFENIPALHRAMILAGGITFFWMLESILPLFRFRYRKWQHALPNLFFTFTTVAVNLVFAFAIVGSADFVSSRQIGLLHIFDLPPWLFVLSGLMVLDLIGAWLVHLVEHHVKWMWKFHIIHHSDMHVDTTTANRHHPVESVFRAVFTLAAVWVGGTPVYLVMLYQSLSVVLSQFNHANIALPPLLDKWISWVIVSPNMHKVHHHYRQPLTDTNYGNIFSLWDHFFGTFERVESPSEQLNYGIDVMMQPADSQQIGRLLRMPFEQHRSIEGSKFSDVPPVSDRK